jgi:hypothetical protein
MPPLLCLLFPQVCNHPELFEGQVERWPLQFAALTTELADALKAAAPVVHAGPGRPPKIPASSTWVQVTGFRSHIQVGFKQGSNQDPTALLICDPGVWSKHKLPCVVYAASLCWFGMRYVDQVLHSLLDTCTAHQNHAACCAARGNHTRGCQ